MIFDESTTGLHFDDITKLLKCFNLLRERNNSVVIIENNLEVIKCADHIIDLGPEAGDAGGEVVVTGTPEDIIKVENSWTGKYLKSCLNNSKVSGYISKPNSILIISFIDEKFPNK